MAGIIDTIKLAGTLVLAIPAALAGLDFLLLGGQPFVGGALLFLAVLFVVVQQRLTLPSDLPELAAKRVAGSVLKEPEGEPDDDR